MTNTNCSVVRQAPQSAFSCGSIARPARAWKVADRLTPWLLLTAGCGTAASLALNVPQITQQTKYTRSMFKEGLTGEDLALALKQTLNAEGIQLFHSF